MANHLALVNQNAAIRLPQQWEFDAMEKYANIATQSGLTSLKPAQALFIILKGYELNITPMQALADIHLVNGKPGLSVQLMISLANRSGMLSRLDMPDADEASKTGKATVTAARRDRPDSPITMTFTMADADKAGLMRNPTWKSYPGQMLVNRAVSMVLRRIIPEALSGMYLAEELENIEDAAPSVTIQAIQQEALPAPKIQPHWSEDPKMVKALMKWGADTFSMDERQINEAIAVTDKTMVSMSRDETKAAVLAWAAAYDYANIFSIAESKSLSHDVAELAVKIAKYGHEMGTIEKEAS